MALRTEYPPGTFSWIDLDTTDADAAKAFYGGLLGWSFRDVPIDEDRVYSTALMEDKEVAGIFTGPAGQGGQPCWASYVSVTSADDTARRATELGATLVAEPFDVMAAGRMAVIEDPTGATVSLWEPREHFGAVLVNQHGTLCWNELMTRDPEAATEFYTGLFGWTTEPFGDNYTLYMNGERPAGGAMTIDESMVPVQPGWSIYLAVDDCDATQQQTVAAGGQVVMAAMDIPEVGRMAIISDPQGAVFGIIKLLNPPD